MAARGFADIFSTRPECTPSLKNLANWADLSTGVGGVTSFLMVGGGKETVNGVAGGSEASMGGSLSSDMAGKQPSLRSVARCFLAYSLLRGRMMILPRDASL